MTDRTWSLATAVLLSFLGCRAPAAEHPRMVPEETSSSSAAEQPRAVPKETSSSIDPSANASKTDPSEPYLFNDAHVHLTNYIQRGPDVRTFLGVMGEKVGRAALFGIPLQQTWAFHISGDYAPDYYLSTDAALYYYSFTDAFIATTYLALRPEEQARFDPTITGFNPADMYAVDHIRRVLETFPGVFSGIGEFTIHKEFVSAKIAGEKASLSDPALDRILALAEETGLLVIIHNDITIPFSEEGEDPIYLDAVKDLFRRHPGTSIIWSHVGVGRVVHPVERHARLVEEMLRDPRLAHLHFDISWTEAAKYLTQSAEATRRAAALINAFPDRFLFGSDEVAPDDPSKYFAVYEMYRELWAELTPEAREKVLKGNYERLFDAASRRVRAWEATNVRSR